MGSSRLRRPIEEGVAHAELSTMVARDRLERVAHGVYRVPQVAVTEFDQYQLAVLWTGVPKACLSHDTALAAWEVSDINPDRIHLTVAHHRRIRRAGGELYAVHHEDLDPKQVTWWQGIPTANVPTAIAQCITSGVPTYLIRQALDCASRTSRRLLAADAERLGKALEAHDG
jgi:predicted transcriptional regulator of viral defense system